MLESVFDNRHEQHGSDWQIAAVAAAYMHIEHIARTQAQLHQRDVVAGELQVALQSSLGYVIDHIAQQMAQLVHSPASLIAVEVYQGVNRCECVENEMGVELGL